MATIDIGKLTFTHKGDYAGGTAYVLNDVVYYNGSAYIAKQSTTGNVPTNTTYWSTFAAGSGGIWNSGLSIGSAGQVVKVNSGASALEFGNLSSDFVKLHEVTMNGSDTGVTFDNYFSSDYKHFKIIVDKAAPDTNTYDGFYIRLLDASGSTRSSNNYRNAFHYIYFNSTSHTQSSTREWNIAQFRLHTDHVGAYEDRYKPFWLEMDILDPMKADTRTRVYFRSNADDGSGDSEYVNVGSGYLDVAEANRGFRFFSRDGDAIDSRCTIKLYGIK